MCSNFIKKRENVENTVFDKTTHENRLKSILNYKDIKLYERKLKKS